MNSFSQTQARGAAQIDEGLRAHMNKVYATMSVGVGLTGAVAWAIGTSPAYLAMVMDVETGSMTPLGWAALLIPFVMVLFFGSAMKMSAAALRTYFYAYSALMGVSLSTIFAVYTGISIAQTFFVTAGAFAGLSLYGYTTKRDISGWGGFLIMGLIGMILASVVNLWLASPEIYWATTVIGLFIFAGLTAYDTQKIKQTYLDHAYRGDEEMLDKAATAGALDLYLDFVNLLLYLLRIFGERK